MRQQKMHIMVIPFHDDMSNVKDYRVDHGHIFVSENLWKNSMYYYLTHADIWIQYMSEFQQRKATYWMNTNKSGPIGWIPGSVGWRFGYSNNGKQVFHTLYQSNLSSTKSKTWKSITRIIFLLFGFGFLSFGVCRQTPVHIISANAYHKRPM